MSIAEKLTRIAEKISKVFDAGMVKGIEQGRQEQYDEFWDKFQQDGKRTNYRYAFGGVGWNDDTFKPKHIIKPTGGDGASDMFAYSSVVDLTRDDVKSKLQITSACGNCYGIFRFCSKLKKVGKLDVAGAGNHGELFSGCTSLESVEEITTSASRTCQSAFLNCTKLTEIRYTGVIGQNLDIRYSPLSKGSIESIIGHLSTTATGKTLSLNKSAVNAAFNIDVDDENTYPEGSEYYILRHSRDNWTFNYYELS